MDDMERLIKRCTDRHGRIDKQMLHARGVLSDTNLFGPDDINPNPLGGAPLVEAKGFSAQGTYGTMPYWIAVFWGGELSDRVQIRGRNADELTMVLGVHEGDYFEFAHPGPTFALRLDNALSILTALMNLSEDFHWHGDKPPGYPRFRKRDDVVH